MIKLSSLFIFFAVLAFLAENGEAFSQNPTGSIAGHVVSKSTQKPIAGVTIKIIGTNLGAFSKVDGSYRIENVPVGIYQIQYSSVAYETYVNSNTAIVSGKTFTFDVDLNDKVIRLEGAEVRSSYFVKKVETATSTQTLNAEDIRRAPGVQEDVLRAAALLPGVAVTSAGRNDLIVRGGAPFENLFVVDNIEVPNINHFGTQGSSGGPLSIINIDFVREVSFSAGAFGARFGDKLSSMTNITLRNGSEDQFGGKAFLSATGLGLNLEGPIADKGSYLFSVRRSYLDFVFKAVGFSFIPEYWDFHSKINYKLDQKNILTFLTIGALGTVKLNNDDADNRFDNSQIAAPRQDQYFSGLTWRHLFERGFSTVTLGETFTTYSTFQNDSNLVKILNNESKEAETSLRIDFDFSLFKTLQLTFGNQTKYATSLDYNVFIDSNARRDQFGKPHEFSLDTSFNALKNATYFNITEAFGKFKLTLGARGDYYNFLEKKFYISPRFSAVYQLNELSAFSMSGGRYFQSPSYIWLLSNTDNKLKAIEADQIVLAYDHTPLEDVKVQVEVYYKWYSDYPARQWRPYAVLAPTGFDNLSDDIPYGLEPLQSSGKGYSRGVEIFIQKKLSTIPLYGLMSFSLGESKFKSILGGYKPSAYDSRIIFNLAAGYRFNSEWEVSSKFRFSTGNPTTEYLPTGEKNWIAYNEGERLPVFHSLDVRIDKRWNYSQITLITYLDIQNVYGRPNVSGVRWNRRTGTIEYQKSIGLLPSIGVSCEF